MYYNLLQSDKVIKDIAQFEDAVNSIANPRRKKFFEDLLNDYKNHLTLISNQHNASIAGKIDPVSVRDDMEELIKIRNIFYNLNKS